MSAAFQDLRHAARTLSRSPGFAAASILILALGIGANTAIFSVVRAVLLRPLPFREPRSLAWVWATRVDRDKAFYSIPNFRDTRAQARSFRDLAGFSPWGPTLSGEPEPERLSAVRVTGNALSVLGVRSQLGRILDGADAEPQASRVAVISHGLWARRFGGDPAIVGRTVVLNGETYSVVGVLPPGFLFPGAEDADLAVPLSLQGDPRREERGSNFLRVFGRLSPGVDPRTAQAELTGITAKLARLYPEFNAKLTAPRVLPLSEEIVGGSRRLLLILTGAVGLLLLVASANLASLAFVRGLHRRHEVSIRKALGASTGRLIAPAFAEAALVAAAGGLLGLVVAQTGVPLLLALAPSSIPRASDAAAGEWNGWVLAFTAAVAAGCAILCGIGPAALAARAPAVGSLGRYGHGPASGGRASRAFVLAQIAISLVLLSGAGLLAKSFARAWAVDPGFRADHALAVRLTLVKSRYPDPDAVRLFFERATSRLRELPGVASAGVASVLPLSGMNARNDFQIVGRPVSDPSRTPGAQNRWVDAGYFATLGIPVLRGRVFTDRDDARAPLVAVVDEVLAASLWPGEDPIGARIRMEDAEGRLREVALVGIVGRVKHFQLEEEPLGTLYAPLAQIPENMLSNLLNSSNLVVRTSVEPLSLAVAVRREIRSIDPDVPTGSVRALGELRGSALAPRRFLALLLGLFALSGALLAATGLYGALAQMVARERRSIGVRLALGASRADILALVARRGVGLAVAGVALGLAAALPLSRLMAAAGGLYGVSAVDPLAYGAAALFLVAVSAIACGLPALKASRVDPGLALKAE